MNIMSVHVQVHVYTCTCTCIYKGTCTVHCTMYNVYCTLMLLLIAATNFGDFCEKHQNRLRKYVMYMYMYNVDTCTCKQYSTSCLS